MRSRRQRVDGDWIALLEIQHDSGFELSAGGVEFRYSNVHIVTVFI